MQKRIVAIVFVVLITFFFYHFAETVEKKSDIMQMISDVDGTVQIPEMMDDLHTDEVIVTFTGQEELDMIEESEKQGYYREAVENAQLDWEWMIAPGEYEDFVFLGGNCIAVRKENGKYSVLDENHHFVFLEEYDLISPYSENMALVRNNGTYFYIDKTGRKVIEGFFQDAKSFQEKKAAVQIEGSWGFINSNGKVVIECLYDQVNSFQEGYAAVKKEDGWGFVDGDGKMTVPCQFDEVKDYSEELAAVQKDGKWGYIDKTGQLVIGLQYDDVGSFSEGKAAVKQEGYTENGLDAWAYINSENEVVLGYYIDWQIPAFSMYASEFHDGLAYIVDEVPTIINEKGEKVFDSPFFITGYADSKYKAIPGYLFKEDLMKERKYGLVDVDGKCLLAPIFYDVHGPYEDYVRVEIIVGEELCEGVIRLKNK